MPNTAHTPGWLRFFKPEANFFQLLAEQSATTVNGAQAFRDWLVTGALHKCQALHDLEHKADDQKMQVEKLLAATVVTPFDREDIYDLSAKMDLIIDGLKKTVRDIEYQRFSDVDQYMKAMSERLVKGTELVASAIGDLEKNLSEAEKAANHARKTESKVAQIHREAMDALYGQADPIDLVRRKEIYDSLVTVSCRIEAIGEKLLHLCIKLS